MAPESAPSDALRLHDSGNIIDAQARFVSECHPKVREKPGFDLPSDDAEWMTELRWLVQSCWIQSPDLGIAPAANDRWSPEDRA
jgi:hypothetical protein